MEHTMTVFNIDALIAYLQTIKERNPTITLGHVLPISNTVDMENGLHVITATVMTPEGNRECLLIR